MTVTTKCPTTTELQALIDNDLPELEQADLTAHLDVCEYCQAALESLASQGRPLMKLVPKNPEPRFDATSAFWPAVRNLEADFSKASRIATSVAATAPASGRHTPTGNALEDVPLTFLDPVEEPGYLGRLDRFKIVEIVGRGGMGIVFKAFDQCLERTIAIKVLDPQLAKNELAQERFCREARAAARVMHENVVTIHHVEHDEDKDLSYIVMQFVNGISLQERLDDEGKLPVRELVRISLQIASGLAAAHEQKLIHRDIKPGNVLLERGSGRVLLTDFGLARAAERDERLTQTGFVAGTPLFMSPEQARGEDLDTRTDLFSLGGVMYAMATGKPPFEGSSPYVVLRQVTETRHRPVQELNSALSDELIEIIDRLLMKEPGKRIQTADEVVSLLRAVEQKLPRGELDGPAPSSKHNLSRLLPRWRRGWWGRHGSLIGFVLFFATAGLFASEAMKWSKLTILGQRDTPALQALVPHEDPGPEPRLTLPAAGGPIWAIHFSPTENILAIGMDDGRVRLWDADKKRLLKDFQAHKGPVWTLRFCTGGTHLATASDDGIFKVWSTTNYELIAEKDNGSPIRVLALSPAGHQLATGSRQGDIKVWEIDNDKPVFTGKGHEGTVVSLAFSPDGTKLVSGGGDKTVKIWDLKKGQELTTLKGHQGGVYTVAFQPGGKLVASGSWDRTIRIWEAETGTLVRTIEGHAEDVWSLAFSPDGTKLISGGEDRTVRLWDVASGEELKRFKGHQGTVYSVSYSHDGKLIASGSRDGKLRIWEVGE